METNYRNYLPYWNGCDDELRAICINRAHDLYGEELPQQVTQRMNHELKLIIANHFAGLYMICYKMLKESSVYYADVYFRGAAGNSFVAFLCGLTNTINPLGPHYRCIEAHYTEFIKEKGLISPASMQKKKCPICGKNLVRDGYNLDYVFMSYPEGDREPDFDFNVSYSLIEKIVDSLKRMDCLGNVIRAGKKTDDGVVPFLSDTLRGYYLIPKNVVVEDFWDIAKSEKESFANFDYHALDDKFYRLDILGHGPTAMLNDLRVYTEVDPLDIDLDDPDVKSLFLGELPYGLSGIPECGDHYGQNVIAQFKMASFDDLIKYSGISHGTNTWLGNAFDLLEEGTASIRDIIASRDDIYDWCIDFGIDSVKAFEIATDVRKGNGVSKDDEAQMTEHGIPDWVIDSCNKIKYLFPRAHTIAYILQSWRVAYYKINYPEDFYRAYFDAMSTEESLEIIKQGYERIEEELEYYNSMEFSEQIYHITRDLEVAKEMFDRGYSVI